jgi:type I restriction modification DNA specificity domain protein
MNKQQEPRLRFKGYVEKWNVWRLGAFGKATGGTSLESEFCETGKYKVISIGSYSEESTYTDQGIRINKNDKTEKKILNENDLTMILNDKTSSGRIIGRVLLIDQNDTYVYNQRTQRIEIDRVNFIPLFLYHFLNAENIRQKVIFSAQGNTQIYVNWSSIKNLEYFIPSTKTEQTHLGNFFRRLDSQIAESRAVLEKSRQLKKAMLAKMFPANGEKIPKIRFKGFEGEWREWKLGAFGKATSGTSLESEFCEDGNYKVISIGSYSEKSTYIDQGIRTHKNDKTEKRILNKNDLTMILNDKTSSGRIIGRVLLIDQNDTYVYNQRTQRIEIDQEHFIPLFLYHLLNADNMRQKIIYSAQGNTQIYVNWSSIKNLEYLIPPTKAEQTAIGNFFRQLDETIALQSAEVEKLNQLKKGLLAAMLV